MSNDSTAAGYLTPTGPPPLYDEALEREISRWIRAVSGLPPGMVLPRFTDPQPQIPPNGTTWCGFSISAFDQDAFPALITGEESSEQWEQESLDVLCCFYGPAGQQAATRFRAGIFISQNNDELKRLGLTLWQCGKMYGVPELINNQWVRRYDIIVRLRRKVTREYGIKSLVEAPVQFFGE
ncbi:phage neck terminator protein [Serratia fonticola]|uniref:phage neck terminator protein n=1 Tax=Serratia fonticola TaxID=47917 RepID=UPI001FB97ECE|nr:hypothetical protein [Serratia fonticola]